MVKDYTSNLNELFELEKEVKEMKVHIDQTENIHEKMIKFRNTYEMSKSHFE